jgi:hypothetical protein
MVVKAAPSCVLTLTMIACVAGCVIAASSTSSTIPGRMTGM